MLTDISNVTEVDARRNLSHTEWKQMKRKIIFLIFIAIFSIIATVSLNTGRLIITAKTAIRTKEPLLIIGEQHHFSLLPAGTVLYFDRGWPEGHLTYHAYFDIKGEFQADPADHEMMSPLWLRTIDSDEMPKILNDYPITKNELVQILKARKVSKSDLAQILRDWPNE